MRLPEVLFDLKRLDAILQMFDNSNGKKIAREALFKDKDCLDGWVEAVSFLTEEKFLKEHTDYFEITYKGQSFIHNGGFVGEERRKRILTYCSIIAAICGLIGIVISVVALYCQIRCH